MAFTQTRTDLLYFPFKVTDFHSFRLLYFLFSHFYFYCLKFFLKCRNIIGFDHKIGGRIIYRKPRLPLGMTVRQLVLAVAN